MNTSRIVLFAILLLVLQVAAGALVTLALGVEEIERLMVGEYIVGAVVSICVFAYMAWADPTKPYLSAFSVGVLAALIGAVSSTLIVGDMSRWHPATLILDIPVLLVAVVLGASVGVMLNRRNAADL